MSKKLPQYTGECLAGCGLFGDCPVHLVALLIPGLGLVSPPDTVCPCRFFEIPGGRKGR